jgi:hypothetical protein
MIRRDSDITGVGPNGEYLIRVFGKESVYCKMKINGVGFVCIMTEQRDLDRIKAACQAAVGVKDEA